MQTGRLETFSDGVLAIAITLLVLDLHVPDHPAGGLWSALVHEWPQFAAYIISFLIIGAVWLNHHSLVHSLKHIDHLFLFLNLLLLLAVALVPFPTSLMASVIGDGGRDASVAAAIYAVWMEFMTTVASLLWLSATKGNRLLKTPMEPSQWRSTAIRFGLSHIPYIGAIILAFINPYLSLALMFLTVSYYGVNQLARS